MPHNPDSTVHHSILTKLRALVPHRHLSIEEALRIAELQATHLLALQHIDEAPVPSEVITELPKLRVEYANTPVSGACFWDGHDWVIELNPRQTHTRRRFILAHEYKHIIDHGLAGFLYPPQICSHGLDHAEYAADYFAGCLLVPKTQLKRAFAHGIQSLHDLARHFDVTERAIATRLKQTGLSDPTPRCMDRHHQQHNSIERNLK